MRHPQWEQRLHDYVERVRDKPHKYGQHDCLLHAANAVKAVTGKDYGRGHRGKYRSAASASRYLRGLGYASPEAMLDDLLEQKPVGFAQRGDLVLVPADEIQPWPIPAVVYGDYALVVGLGPEDATNLAMRDGLHRVPRSQWLKAYAVGDHHSGKLKVRKKRVTRANS